MSIKNELTALACEIHAVPDLIEKGEPLRAMFNLGIVYDRIILLMHEYENHEPSCKYGVNCMRDDI